ncbi:hypothetical protein [Micromonospora aurantiaca (nom. illeg.)]|uniref:hypothetical protein n=1 Tax=Micromonospora aurantiaca (nom. illeg.) TaxID=47850 RepID=UPI0033D6FE35
MQGLLPALTVPQSRHISIQRLVDLARVDLDGGAPPVEQRCRRGRPVPELAADLDAAVRREAALDHLLDQIDAASHYICVPAEDLPRYVWSGSAGRRQLRSSTPTR